MEKSSVIDRGSLDREADERAVTGLRWAPRGAGVAAGSTEAARAEGSPLESWNPDDGLESLPPVVAGQLLGGKYVVERTLAEGGMGVVCLAYHVQLGQAVAIKFLRRALSGRESVVHRFLDEARALAALRSDHVVRVTDVGQLDSGRPYFVMEHLEGLDLEALIARDGPLGIDTAIRYMLEVCEALTEAHALGIVHGDIKPENLFLSSGGPGRDIVKVLDFGLSRSFSPDSPHADTDPHDTMGSPCYMSPEQITTPQLVDSRTDVWSLGVALHVLLTGDVPFGGAVVSEVFAHVLNAAPRSLLHVVAGADVELDAILHRCLQKSPDDRYQTVPELVAALNGFAARRHDLASRPRAPVEFGEPSSAADDHEKIRIPGVHARWPWVLLGAALLSCLGVYQADRSGLVRVRDLTDGRLTPAGLARDETAATARVYGAPLIAARGVTTLDPTFEADGTPTIRGEPERGKFEGTTAGPPDEAERLRQRAAFREFFGSAGE